MKRPLKTFLVLFVFTSAAIACVVLPMILAELPRWNFQKNLKKRASPAELQAWAMNVLAPFQTNADPIIWITVTNLHPALRGLEGSDNLPPNTYVRNDSQLMFDTAEAIPYVKVTYGAAAGHFGVIAGPTNLPTPASWPHVVRYTPWAPGIWFFDGQ